MLDTTQYTVSLFGGGGGTPTSEIQEGVRRGVERAIGLLEGAVRSFKERLEDMGMSDQPPQAAAAGASPVHSSGQIAVDFGTWVNNLFLHVLDHHVDDEFFELKDAADRLGQRYQNGWIYKAAEVLKRRGWADFRGVSPGMDSPLALRVTGDGMLARQELLGRLTDNLTPVEALGTSAPRAADSKQPTPALGHAITISPTIYALGPNASILVGQTNALTVDRGSAAFRQFEDQVAALIEELRGSNELDADAKGQLTGELRAGLEIVKTPKPERNVVQAFLVRPLQWIAKEFVSGSIRALAATALATLGVIASGLLK
jgi:hypothetical protein